MAVTDQQPAAAPAWLDIDPIVPTELRDQMRDLAGRLEALGPVLAELAAESVQVRDAYNEATRAAAVPDGTRDLVGELSGFDRLFDAWMALATRACDVTECVPV